MTHKQTHMSTQHCGLTAPVASTTVYLFGAVHSTGVEIRKKKKKLKQIVSKIC